MIYLDIQQGTDEWLAARRGIPTASNMKKIITPTGKLSATADKYIAELIGEIIEPDDFEGNKWTERGHLLEPEARAYYEFITGETVTEMGMILREDGKAGVSPDGLIGGNGMLEIKCPKPSTHVFWMMKGVLPPEHKPQCHAALHIAEREYLDFISYCPGLEPLLVRVTPDEYTELLGDVLEKFIKKLEAAKGRVFEG